MSAAVATESGLMPLTDKAVDQHLSTGVKGYHAHYQLETSQRAGHPVYWVECLSEEDGKLVEIVTVEELMWAGCPCDFYQKYWKPWATCKRVATVIQYIRSRKR